MRKICLNYSRKFSDLSTLTILKREYNYQMVGDIQ